MKRLVLIQALALGLLASSASGFVAAATASTSRDAVAVAATRPRAWVAACDRTHRSAAFEARMDAVHGAELLQMRFRLQVSTPDQPAWTRLAVPGFSAWLSADPGRQRFLYTKRVEQLVGPARYRVQVWFRWLDAAGATLRTAHVVSRACRQPDPRPDLTVTALGRVGPGRYDVAVKNVGRGDAGASSVELVFPGGSSVTAAVPPMTPGDREDVFVSGPACRLGQLITAIADAGDVVDERDEANAVTLPCPPA